MTLAHKILGQITVDSTGLVTVPKPFVALGGEWNDVGVYSADGITWTTIPTLPEFYGYSSLAYGGGKYAALSRNDNYGMYSTDAITWTQTTLPDDPQWNSATYGDGKFVAVGSYSSAAAVSTDGITWTASTLPASASWNSVGYGNGKFVAVAYYSTNAAISTYCTTWTTSALPAGPTSWSSVAYGDGKLVAVATFGTTAAYSTDAITWTASTLPSATWVHVSHSGSAFVAFATDSSAAYSTDAITWTQTTLSTSSNWAGFAGGDANNQESGFGAPQTIYTVPSSTEAIVSSIFIGNTSTTTDTYSFAVVPSGETLSDIHYIRKNTDIVAKDFHNIDTKITMSAGDSLVATSGAADKLNINVFGVEKS